MCPPTGFCVRCLQAWNSKPITELFNPGGHVVTQSLFHSYGTSTCVCPVEDKTKRRRPSRFLIVLQRVSVRHEILVPARKVLRGETGSAGVWSSCDPQVVSNNISTSDLWSELRFKCSCDLMGRRVNGTPLLQKGCSILGILSFVSTSVQPSA